MGRSPLFCLCIHRHHFQGPFHSGYQNLGGNPPPGVYNVYMYNIITQKKHTKFYRNLLPWFAIPWINSVHLRFQELCVPHPPSGWLNVFPTLLFVGVKLHLHSPPPPSLLKKIPGSAPVICSNFRIQDFSQSLE